MNQALRLQKIKKVALTFKQSFPNLKGSFVKVVEVGPRDGLQNQKQILSVQQKVKLINQLSSTGLSVIQVGSFVSPKWVPQMASSKQVYQQINKVQNVSYPCLTPNIKGLQTAIEAGVKQVAVFASATEGFSQKNLNCSIRQSLDRFKPVMQLAKSKNIKVRGYISMVMGCPFDGQVDPIKVKNVASQLFQLGCYQVSLGDTVGKGNVQKTRALFNCLKGLPMNKLAAHFHDTFDTAIQNMFTALQFGVKTVDSSIGGLGGCPYSMKPVGNVCTQNVVFALKQAGLVTKINEDQLGVIDMQSYATPLQMVKKSIGSHIHVRLRNKTQIQGKLIAYDDHLNMMIDEALIRKGQNLQQKNLMYLRGETVILIGQKGQQ